MPFRTAIPGDGAHCCLPKTAWPPTFQRMLVGMQTSEFQQWTEESKMELESSCFDEMVKGVLTSSMGNEDACNSRK